MSRQQQIIVIGGGAAGLMAAGTAAEAGARVRLLEKMKRPGRKLCISGKGRCNLTNVADLRDFIQHFGKNGRFLHQPFSRFFAPELIDFFETHGLPLATERGGRVFPDRGKATDVYHVFLDWLQRLNVPITTSSPVSRLLVDQGRITGVRCQHRTLSANAVILATGGSSYPATGSTGDGLELARQVGHSFTPVRPALVPLVTETTHLDGLNGLALKNVSVRLFVNGKRKKQLFGEMGFTRYGVNGPMILTLSGYCVDCLRAGKTLQLAIDLKPALDAHKLDNRLQRDLRKRHGEPISSILRGLLPHPLVPVCLRLTRIDPERLGAVMSGGERRRLGVWLKDFRLPITGHRPLKEAIVTAGGIHLKEINPNTMGSLKVNGLYIVGELLDLHGDTGGYNLQAAFSTGRLAGQSAARALQP